MLAFGPRLRRLTALTGVCPAAPLPQSIRPQVPCQFFLHRHLCADFDRHLQGSRHLILVNCVAVISAWLVCFMPVTVC